MQRLSESSSGAGVTVPSSHTHDLSSPDTDIIHLGSGGILCQSWDSASQRREAINLELGEVISSCDAQS